MLEECDFIMIKITTPLTKEKIIDLKAGQEVLFSGVIYTARDQAHKRLVNMIDEGKELPITLEGNVIYYTGPSPAPFGKVIGSCGPTTSSRMDKYVLPLLKSGVIAMIGKGRRSEEVRNLISKYKAIYFLAPAGCGALISEKVKESKVVIFEDLGPEAIYCLKVESLPLIVGIDSYGNDIYNDQNR